MGDRLTDERLRQLRDDPYVCSNENERAMADELLELRTCLAEAQRQRDDARGVLSCIGPVLGYVALARTALAYLRIHPTVDAAREWGRGKNPIIAELREMDE